MKTEFYLAVITEAGVVRDEASPRQGRQAGRAGSPFLLISPHCCRAGAGRRVTLGGRGETVNHFQWESTKR